MNVREYNLLVNINRKLDAMTGVFKRSKTPTIKCSLCGEAYDIYYSDAGVIDVNPHICPFVDEDPVAFVDRVCPTCDDQIRCRRDGFECKEAIK